MKQILDILIQYWKPITGLLFFVVGFIVALIRKKPINNILQDIYFYSIEAVNEAEVVSKTANIKGEVKLARAVEFVMEKLIGLYPTIKVQSYIKVIEKVIEDLLTTPHKKGD